MTQTLMAFKLSDAASVKTVTAELSSRGYAVGDANRMVKPAIHIRVREGTGDQAEVEQVVTSLDPNAIPMPPGSPTMILVGYREER